MTENQKMGTPVSPLNFFSALKWIDGRPLLDVIEPYRRRIFTEALYTIDPDGRPRYNLVLSGRAKKNWKSADLCLSALSSGASSSTSPPAGDSMDLAEPGGKRNPTNEPTTERKGE